MKVLTSCIDTHCNISDVFGFISDFSNFEKIFDDIVKVEILPVEEIDKYPKYTQTRRLHGMQWREAVNVCAIEDNSSIMFSIIIFGVETFYMYRFESLGGNVTRIHLKKETKAKGMMKFLNPLIHHVLTRPEHDGQHLMHLKQALEEDQIF